MQRLLSPALAALAILAAAPLSGCGFTPLYGTPGMIPSLGAVDVVVERVEDARNVDALQNRIHFLLREQLDDELGHNPGAPTRYQLICTTRLSRVPRGVRVNNVANRYEINFTVNYTLKAAGGVRVFAAGFGAGDRRLRFGRSGPTPASPPSRTGRPALRIRRRSKSAWLWRAISRAFMPAAIPWRRRRPGRPWMIPLKTSRPMILSKRPDVERFLAGPPTGGAGGTDLGQGPGRGARARRRARQKDRQEP